MNISNSAEARDSSQRDSTKWEKPPTVPQDGETQFQRPAECAHFHYDFVDFGELKLTLDEDADAPSEQCFSITVSCNSKWWTIHRTYESLRELDKQLHLCVYDRKFSMLPELSVALNEKEGSMQTLKKISSYLNRLSALANNLIYCGPILCWMEMDSHGNHFVVTEDAAVNIPAIGAAHAVRRYVALSPDEISLEVGDILSIIDKPPSHESTWWRGKKGFQVGYFPSDCIELIETRKIPPSVATMAPPSAKPVLNKQGKMMSFLNGYFSSRPNRSHLKQTGIVKERVFGCDLGEHLLNSGQDVPLVLKCCAKVLEKHGIIYGIYRLCGVTSNIQKLRNEFDANRVPDLTAQLYVDDVCCISSLVKMYFRDLPNPLLTYQLYDKFISAIDSDSYKTNLKQMREVVRQLPPPHFRTAKFLFKHLSQMASYHSETSMSCKNLAIIWAPNLLRSTDPDIKSNAAMLKYTGLQSDVTEFLIASVHEIFDETGNSSSSLTWPKSLMRSSSGRKLLTLEEAQKRELGSASPKQQKCISAYACSANSTPMYHTVIDLPKDRKKNLRKSAIIDLCSSFARATFVALPVSISSSGSLSKSNSLKPDAVDIDSPSVNTLQSVHSSVCVNEQIMLPVEENCQPSQSENEPKVLESPQSSFLQGSHIPSSSLSASSTESETKSDYPTHRQMPFGISVGSFGSVDTCLDENYFEPLVSSKFIQLDSDYQDRANSLPKSYGRQSVSSVKPEPCPKSTEKKDCQVQNSDFEAYTKPSIQNDICENVSSCLLSPSLHTKQLVSDEKEFLLLAHSESTESRDLCHTSSAVTDHVMPNNDYALSVSDNNLLLCSEIHESFDAYESHQELSETFPATCENSETFPATCENSETFPATCENSEAKCMSLCSESSNSNLHSKKYFIPEDKNQECRKVLRRHSFMTDSFRTCGNKVRLGSTLSLPTDVGNAGIASSASSSLKCTVSCEEIYCKFNQMSSLTEDQLSSVVILESEHVEILEDGLTMDSNSRSESAEILEDSTKDSDSRSEGNEKETCSASVGDEWVNSQESSQCLESLGNEQDPESVNGLNFANEETNPHLTPTDILIDTRDENCRRLDDTEDPLFSVDPSIAALWNKNNLALPLGSESPAYAPESPSFLFDCTSVSEDDETFQNKYVSNLLMINPHIPLSSKPPVPARNSIEGYAELKSTKSSQNPVPCPECLHKCHNLQEESELPPGNVLLDPIDDSEGPLHSESVSDILIESVPVEEYKHSETDSTSMVAEKEEFSPLGSVSSASSSQSDLRPSVSDLPEAEMCDQAMLTSAFGLTADADHHEKEPTKREIDRPPPTSAFEFVPKSEDLFCRLENVNTISTEIRTRSSRWSDPPESRKRSSNTSCMKRVSFPFCFSDVKHRKRHSGTNFGYFKEHKNVFGKAV